MKTMSALAAVAVAMVASAASAETTTTTPTTTPPATKQFVLKKPTTPEGIECSKEADAKGLHGNARKEFRSKCVADLKKAHAKPKA